MSNPTADIDTELDEEWLAAPHSRSRLSAALAAALILSLTFLGGVLVQKHWGATGTGSTASPSGLPGGFPNGAAPSGFPQLGGAAPGGPASAGTSQSGSATTTGSTTVIGTVISIHGTNWIVEDLGGKRHTITVPQETTVVREERSSTGTVNKGDTVTVAGTNAAGNSLNASRITLR